MKITDNWVKNKKRSHLLRPLPLLSQEGRERWRG